MMQDNIAQGQLASTSYIELLETSKPMSLKKFSKETKARDLPCLVKITGGQRSLCDYYSFGHAEMFVALEKRSTRVAVCRDQADGSVYVVPVHTVVFDLVVLTAYLKFGRNRPRSLDKMTVEELLRCQSLPPVMAVSEEFALEEHSEKTLPVGTLLFPKEVKKQAKDQQQGVLRAKTESSEVVHITPDCKGRFSVLATDVRLSLQEAVSHLKPPFTMRTTSNLDTLYVNVVTVEKVHKEDVFVGMMKATEGATIDDIASFTRKAEVPVSLNLTVVTMVPRKHKTLERIYDFAHTGYYQTLYRPAKQHSTSGEVDMDSNPSYTYVDISLNHASVKHNANPATVGQPAAQDSPEQLARRLPRSLMQLSETEPVQDLEDDHIYDSIDYASMVITEPIRSSASSKAAGTTIVSDPPSVTISQSQEESVNDLEANIAYLKGMQMEDILQLLEAMNLSVYKDAFEREYIDGEIMASLNDEMLTELGVSKSLHRLRLRKIASGQTSAKIKLHATVL